MAPFAIGVSAMPSQHKRSPISFRPSEADRARLLQYAADTGQPVNAVLAAALREFLAETDEVGTPACAHSTQQDTPARR